MKQFALPKKKENKGKVPARKSQGNKTRTPPKKASVDHILHLQQTIGNQAVQRMIKSGTLQLDSSRPQPGDVYSREIERLARRVQSSRLSDQLQPKSEPEEKQDHRKSTHLTKNMKYRILHTRIDNPTNQFKTHGTSQISSTEKSSYTLQRTIVRTEQTDPPDAIYKIRRNKTQASIPYANYGWNKHTGVKESQKYWHAEQQIIEELKGKNVQTPQYIYSERLPCDYLCEPALQDSPIAWSVGYTYQFGPNGTADLANDLLDTVGFFNWRGTLVDRQMLRDGLQTEEVGYLKNLDWLVGFEWKGKKGK